MSTPIETNTEELQELLRIANNLPEAVVSPVYQNKTVSPTTEKQTITPDPNYDALSSVTVNGDADLIAANIKSGVDIFGVVGTYEGEDSGGTVAQVKTGITSFYSGHLIVDCGFKPDVVVFNKGEYYSSSSFGSVYYTAAIDLTDTTKTLYGPILLTNSSQYKFYTFYAPTLYDSGMACDLYGTSSSWGETNITSGVTFNYTAYKFK